jgi:hypothetical protein
MADNTYSVEYATNARAKCKFSGCGESIAKDSLRIVKGCSSGFSEKPKAEYYHAECMFLSFVRARKTTKKIESMKDIEGVDGIKPEDKENIKKYIKQFKDGELKDKVPKITRKRKADTDKDDVQKKKKVKKAKDSSSESEEEVKPKVSPKRKPTKKQDSDEDSDDYKDSKKRKITKKQKDSDSDSESEDDDKVSKMMRKPVSKRKDSSESSSEDEAPAKIQIKDSKRKKKNESDDDSEEVKEIKKKKKAESDEEVEETSSSEKQESPKKSKALSGMVIALSGKLSMKSNDVAKLIEKNGGKYSKNITKDVTHVICANMDAKTQKLAQAKSDGKKLVDEKFLKKQIGM